MKWKFQNEEGMTLVELLAAIVLLGIVLVAFMSFFTQSAKFTAHNHEKLTNVQVAENIIGDVRQGMYQKSITFVEDDYKIEIVVNQGPEDLKVAKVTIKSPDGAGIDKPDFTTRMYFKVKS